MRNLMLWSIAVTCVGLFCGWSAAEPEEAPTSADAPPPIIEALYTSTPVTLDGALDEPVWQKAKAYALSLADDRIEKGLQLQEPGEVRLAWDDKNLYLAVKFQDSDIVAEVDKDQVHHYLSGDLAELFLKPPANTWYWELYVTPHQHKTHLWFPGRGRLGLPSADEYEMELHVAAKCDGTLNDWHDKDKAWTGEMAIPIAELTRHGDRFDPETPWRILVARYNYSRYLTCSGPELTMTPKLPITSYHHHEGYGELHLVE